MGGSISGSRIGSDIILELRGVDCSTIYIDLFANMSSQSGPLNISHHFLLYFGQGTLSFFNNIMLFCSFNYLNFNIKVFKHAKTNILSCLEASPSG